jgi:orotate phosphoribosyltransferase
MSTMMYREAIASALAEEMRRDEKVFVMGEDVAITGGVFKATKGLLQEFGPTRVRNTPLSECAIAGVATGAIAQGAMVAEELSMPFAYVRPKPKDHGMGNQIEGELKAGEKVVVIEDLISTGMSSLKAVDALRQAGCAVLGMVANFTYGFPLAEQQFKEAGVTLTTLSNYNAVLEAAVETNYIAASDVETLKEWRKDPANWGI